MCRDRPEPGRDPTRTGSAGGGGDREAGAYDGVMLPDYAEFEQAIGLDWYRMDPNLTFLLDHYLPDPADRAFAEGHVGRFGSLVGEVIAPRAEETDKHGPALQRYDRWGYEVDEIVHNATWTQNKADLVRNGLRQPRELRRAVGAGRGGCLALLPGVPGGDGHLLRSGHDVGGGRHHRAPLADGGGRRHGATPTQRRPRPGLGRGMFLTERQGGSDVGANSMRAVEDGDEWRLFGDKHFCSNVDADASSCWPGPTAPRAGVGDSAPSSSPPPARRFPNGFSIKRLKPKLGHRGGPHR